MIGRDEIDQMVKTLGVHSSHVQRDYVHGWLLFLLYSSSTLAERFVLKGRNCLRKGYVANARYSRDLDFTTSTSISHKDLRRELHALCPALANRSGVVFNTSRTRVEEKRRGNSAKHVSEARLYFRDFYGNKSKMVLGVRLNVSQCDRLSLPVQDRVLLHPYSDFEACKASIRCIKLEELLATQLRRSLQRWHIADVFALVYATLITHKIAINRFELLSTFFRSQRSGSQKK